MEHKVYMNYIHPSSLLRQLSDLWKANRMCDAIITVGDVHVAKAHKVVLIAASPKLKSESDDLTDSSILKVSLPSGISHQTVHIFLRYIYEGYLILTPKSAEDLLKIATFLNIICLANCCKDVLNSFENNTTAVLSETIENRDVEFCHFRKSEVEKFVDGQNDCDREITDHKTKNQMADDGLSHKNRQSPIQSQCSHSPPSDCSMRISETEDIARHSLNTLDQSNGGGSPKKIEQEDDIPSVKISDVTGSTLKQPRLLSEVCPKPKKRKLSSTEMNPTLQTLTSKNSPSSSVLPLSENRSILLPIQIRSSASHIGKGVQKGKDQQQSLFIVQNTQSGKIVLNDKARMESTVQHPVATQIKTEPLCDFTQAADNSNSSDLQEAASSSDVPEVSKSSVPPRELSLEAIKTEPEGELDQTLTSASDDEQEDYDGQTMWFSGDSVQHADPSQGRASSNVARDNCQQRSVTSVSSLTQMRAQQSIKRSIQSSVSAARRTRSMGGTSESVSSPGDQADQSFSSDGKEDMSNEISAVDNIIKRASRDLPSERKVHDCEECPESFASIHGLKSHVYLKHTKAHNCCQLCGKGFASGYEFKVHMAHHQEDFRYDCPSCDENFTYKRELLRHLRDIHHSVGFKCEKCSRTYSSRQNLRKHEKAQHGRKSKTSVTVPTEILRNDEKPSLSTFRNQMPSTSSYSVVERVKASPHSYNIQQQQARVPQPTSVFEHSVSSTSNLKSNTLCESDDLQLNTSCESDDLDNSDDVPVLSENDSHEEAQSSQIVADDGTTFREVSRMVEKFASNDEMLFSENPNEQQSQSDYEFQDLSSDFSRIPHMIAGIEKFTAAELLSKKGMRQRPSEAQNTGLTLIRYAATLAGIWKRAPHLKEISQQEVELFNETLFKFAPQLTSFAYECRKKLGEQLQNRRKYLLDRQLGRNPRHKKASERE